MNQNLGEEPFNVAMDAIYTIVEQTFTKAGRIDHQLIGIMFKDGAVDRLTINTIADVSNVQQQRALMTTMFHMVAHVVEAWQAPPDRLDIAPSQHPKRQEVVSIMLFNKDGVSQMGCPIIPKQRKISRGTILVPDAVGGNLAFDINKPPLSS